MNIEIINLSKKYINNLTNTKKGFVSFISTNLKFLNQNKNKFFDIAKHTTIPKKVDTKKYNVYKNKIENTFNKIFSKQKTIEGINISNINSIELETTSMNLTIKLMSKLDYIYNDIKRKIKSMEKRLNKKIIIETEKNIKFKLIDDNVKLESFSISFGDILVILLIVYIISKLYLFNKKISKSKIMRSKWGEKIEETSNIIIKKLYNSKNKNTWTILKKMIILSAELIALYLFIYMRIVTIKQILSMIENITSYIKDASREHFDEFISDVISLSVILLLSIVLIGGIVYTFCTLLADIYKIFNLTYFEIIIGAGIILYFIDTFYFSNDILNYIKKREYIEG